MFFMRSLLFLIVACTGISAQWPRVKPEPQPVEAAPIPAPAPVQGPTSERSEKTAEAAKWGDAQNAAQSPVFRSSSALVRIDTQVLKSGKAVEGLKAEDFVVLDEGKPVPLAAFGRDSEPLQVALLFDVSGSMNKALVSMSAVAGRAMAALKAEDQVGVLVFGMKVVPLLEFSADLRAAARMVQEAPLEREVGAGTNLNGCVLETLQWMAAQKEFPGRRVLVVLTDNHGMHYQTPDEKVLRALAGMDVTLNAIVAPGARPPKAEPKAPNANPDFTPPDVFKLAEETGGEVFRADKAGERFVEMMERVRLRYDLAIRPQTGPDALFRRLEVRLSEAARERLGKVEINARTGYYTPAPAQ
jgi:VWFA-related protein